MDDIIWVPVSEEEKLRLEKICTSNGITVKDWFLNALREEEKKQLNIELYSEMKKGRLGDEPYQRRSFNSVKRVQSK